MRYLYCNRHIFFYYSINLHVHINADCKNLPAVNIKAIGYWEQILDSKSSAKCMIADPDINSSYFTRGKLNHYGATKRISANVDPVA